MEGSLRLFFEECDLLQAIIFSKPGDDDVDENS